MKPAYGRFNCSDRPTRKGKAVESVVGRSSVFFIVRSKNVPEITGATFVQTERSSHGVKHCNRCSRRIRKGKVCPENCPYCKTVGDCVHWFRLSISGQDISALLAFVQENGGEGLCYGVGHASIVGMGAGESNPLPGKISADKRRVHKAQNVCHFASQCQSELFPDGMDPVALDVFRSLTLKGYRNNIPPAWTRELADWIRCCTVWSDFGAIYLFCLHGLAQAQDITAKRIARKRLGRLDRWVDSVIGVESKGNSSQPRAR